MKYEILDKELHITGGYENDRILEIPATVEGRKVTGIGRYAFRDRLELLEVVLPEGIRYIGGHSFYNCKNLQRLTLHDHVRELEDGAFKNCYRLTEVELYCHENREGCLKNLLSDNIQELTLTIHYEDGQMARMIFPTFEDDYVENTPARIFQAVSFGSGGLYRQCMQVGTLDYRELDLLFDKSVREDRFEAPLMNAVYRLQYPYKLFRSAKERYEEFLRANDRQAVLSLIAQNQVAGIQLLCERKLLRSEVLPEAVEAAQCTGDVSMTSTLVRYQLSQGVRTHQSYDL